MLSPSSALPLYYQVARDLEKQITSKQLLPGKPVPTEAQLCESYGVSRITVRKAMEDLVSKRLVVRHRGVGTFVSESSYANRLVVHVGSLHDAISYSSLLTYRQISRKTVPAPQNVAESLGIEPGADVELIVRLGSVGEARISVTEVYMAVGLAAKLRTGKLLENESITRQLEVKSGESMVRVEQTITSIQATPLLVEWLDIKLRSPILQFTRVYFGATGRPMEVAVVHYHPQRYNFKLEIVQSHGI